MSVTKGFSTIRIAGLGAGCLLAGMLVVFGHGARIGDRQSQNDNTAEFGIWVSGATFEQTFTAVDDHLCRIDFWIDSFRPWDTPGLECRLYELDVPVAPYTLTYNDIRQQLTEVRTVTLNGWRLSPHMFNACTFEPIPNARGKRYLFALHAPEVRRGGSSILTASSRKRWDDDNFFVNGRQYDTDLTCRMLYQTPRLAILRDSMARIALSKPFPFSSPIVIALLFGVYAVLLLVLVWRL